MRISNIAILDYIVWQGSERQMLHVFSYMYILLFKKNMDFIYLVHFAVQAGLKLTNPPTSISKMLE